MEIEGREFQELPQDDLSALGAAGLSLQATIWGLIYFLRNVEEVAKAEAGNSEQEVAVCMDEILRHGKMKEDEVRLVTAIAWAAQFLLIDVLVQPQGDDAPCYFVELTEIGRVIEEPAHIIKVDDNTLN